MIKLMNVAAICTLLLTAAASAAGYDSELEALNKRFVVTDPEIANADASSKRQMTCIALNVYFESRGTIERQQEGVAWVVKNRSKSNKFAGSNMCDVVFQRMGGFPQFAWIAHPSKGYESGSWKQAQAIAKGVFYDRIPDPTHGALSFHEVNLPAKFRKYDRGGLRIGSHVFYNIAAK